MPIRDDTLVEKLMADFYHRRGPAFYAQDDGVHMPADADLFPFGDEAGIALRRDNYQTDIDDHFDSNALSTYWTGWAGAPFVTPPTISWDTASQLRVGNFALAADRAFLYTAGAPASNDLEVAVGIRANTTGVSVGARMDDGTDNNYVEVVLIQTQVYPSLRTIRLRYRVGGGAILPVAPAGDGSTLVVGLPYIARMQILGTRWTNWYFQSFLECMFSNSDSMYQFNPGALGLAWTPTRFGIIFDQGGVATAAFHRLGVDFFKEG